MRNKKNVPDLIDKALDKIRPFLKQDGGDVELVEVTNDMVVKLELKGSCKSCLLNSFTFTNGIEDTIIKEVPYVKQVVTINPTGN